MFKNTPVKQIFVKLQKVLLSEWVCGLGGWMGECVVGCGSDKIYFSKSHIFLFVNKQIVLIPNIGLKVITSFYIKSYKHFKFSK